jgi:hypothetical protein
MSETEEPLGEIVEALRRRSTHTLLQRRVTYALDHIETVLAAGWSMTELAAHLAAAGVTHRGGQRLTAGHFAVMVTRARAKARSRRRQQRSHPSQQIKPAPRAADEQRAASTELNMADNLAALAERSVRQVAEQEREAAIDRDIGAALDAMFGRNQLPPPPSPNDPKASTSASLKRPRRRQAR